VKQKNMIRLRFLFPSLLLGMGLISATAELHYPPYVVPLMIRPQDPVTSAMGLTGVAYRSGSLAVLTNPAGLSFLYETELAGVHVPAQDQGLIPENRPQYLNQESVAIGHPFHGFVLGGMFLYYNLGSSSEGQEDGTSASHFVRMYQVSCSRRFSFGENCELSTGLNLKRIENKLAHKHGVGYLGDIGFQIHHTQDTRVLMAGLSVSNLGPDIRYKMHLDTEYETPLQLLRIGAAARFLNQLQFFQTDILAALEYQRNLNEDQIYFQNWELLSGGVECRVFKFLFVRMGMVLDLETDRNRDSIEGFTFGLGFHTQIPFESMPPLHLELDYGRGLDISDLNQNMISLTLGYDLTSENLVGF